MSKLSTNKGNDYLALREAKIKRNNERLQELGLVTASKSKSKQVSGKKKHNIIESMATRVDNIPGVLRRSTRTRVSVSNLIVDGADDDNVVRKDNGHMDILLGNTKKRKRNSSAIEKDDDEERKDSITHKTIKMPQQSEAKPGTTRATIIDVSKVFCGDFNYPVFIGRQLKMPGKASVVEHANLLCRNDFGISFNKYSGVCEWRNNAIFLWVNIGAPDAEVNNEFFNTSDDTGNGMQMTWYGGSKMKPDSIAIQKLVLIGQKAAKNELPPSDGIVLWCRLYNKTKKTFDPYTCIGRLSYHSHDPEVRPIKFVWNLIDYDILKENDEIFNELVESSRW